MLKINSSCSAQTQDLCSPQIAAFQWMTAHLPRLDHHLPQETGQLPFGRWHNFQSLRDHCMPAKDKTEMCRNQNAEKQVFSKILIKYSIKTTQLINRIHVKTTPAKYKHRFQTALPHTFNLLTFAPHFFWTGNGYHFYRFSYIYAYWLKFAFSEH